MCGSPVPAISKLQSVMQGITLAQDGVYTLDQSNICNDLVGIIGILITLIQASS